MLQNSVPISGPKRLMPAEGSPLSWLVVHRKPIPPPIHGGLFSVISIWNRGAEETTTQPGAVSVQLAPDKLSIPTTYPVA